MASTSMCVRLVRGLTGSNSSMLMRTLTGRLQLRGLAGAAAESNEKSSETKVENGETPNEAEEALKAFQEEKEKLTKQMKELEDKYKRSLAETENVRMRMKKQVADAKQYGIQGFAKDLLEVADILNKATDSVPPEQVNDNPHLKGLFEGLTMTESQLQRVFSRHGISAINPPAGEKFDPHIHEALFQQVVDSMEAGTVAVVTKIGYKLHERTIRPALVGVVKAP